MAFRVSAVVPLCLDLQVILDYLGPMGRGGPFVRQFRLMRYLDEHHEVAIYEAARELGCSPRTLYRDLEVLQEVGVPLYQERQGKRVRWKVVDGFKQRFRLDLSWSEMLALATGRDLLKGLSGTLFHESAITALEKIRSNLPAPLVERVDAAGNHVSVDPGQIHDYGHRGELVRTLTVALQRCETVEIEYRKPSQDQFEKRVVDPYHLHVQAGALYVIAWCHHRKAPRVFLIDRIRGTVLTGSLFQRHASERVPDLLQGSFGLWDGVPTPIELRFSPDAARFVLERNVHPSQKNVIRNDRHVDVSLLVAESPSLVSWIVSWGPRVVVIMPRRLRTRVRREHAMAAKY